MAVKVAQYSFPREARLLKPAEFKRVFQQAEVSSDRLFRVLARKREGQSAQSRSYEGSGMRLGMAVSRKVDSRAVVRNRIKRIIRESFRHERQAVQPGEGQGIDYVVLANAASAAANQAELRQSLARHWRQLDRKLA